MATLVKLVIRCPNLGKQVEIREPNITWRCHEELYPGRTVKCSAIVKCTCDDIHEIPLFETED